MQLLRNPLLVESLASALEVMAFVTLSPVEGPIEPPDDALLVRITFDGASKGSIEMLTSQALGRLLVENTFAPEPGESAEAPQPNDALIELLNIACGLLLKQRDGGARFEMSVPHIAPADAAGYRRFFEGGPCDVVLADTIPVAIRVTEN